MHCENALDGRVMGFGVGVLWVPITMVAFSTLHDGFVSEASAVFHMVRNIGSSVHISLSIALAVHMTRTGYAELAERGGKFGHGSVIRRWRQLGERPAEHAFKQQLAHVFPYRQGLALVVVKL